MIIADVYHVYNIYFPKYIYKLWILTETLKVGNMIFIFNMKRTD